VPQQLIPLMGKPSRALVTPKCDVANITPGQALGRSCQVVREAKKRSTAALATLYVARQKP
jgi:hypothetical protein